MFNQRNYDCHLNLKICMVFAFIFLTGFSSANDDLSMRLQQADSFRLQGDSSKTTVEVSEYKANVLKKTNHYDVFFKRDKGTIVLFKGASDSGQKLLMLDDKFWMFLPKARRPIRITPMQKLLGDAAAGDIATVSWNDSYNVALKKTLIEFYGVEALEVTLTSKLEGNSYETIDLVLTASDSFPLKADLFLKSGKLVKTAIFERGERDGRQVVLSMSLRDGIQKNQKTVIQYQSAESVELVDKIFNPSYLSKNSSLF